MSILSLGHIAGIIATLTLVSAVGVYAGTKVKSAEDFATSGRKAGSTVVAGTIMGTLVSGASTIGTAQLAFQYGFSAWWFTLGAGIACAILGLAMVSRMYQSKVETIPQYLVTTYGDAIGPIATLFTSLGIMISLIAQTLAFVALMTAMFPVSQSTAAIIGVFLVLVYVLFGGVWGTGLTGVAKLILLYIAMIACGGVAYQMAGGIDGLTASLPALPFFSLFGRGFAIDVAAGFSLIVGVLSTQTYFQAVLSGKTMQAARGGVLASAVLIPPVGLGGILVGLFMRANFPGMPSSEALPLFVLTYLPPVLAGVVMATLLITVIGGWAGLTLGVATMLTKDIYQRFFRSQASSGEILMAQRICIILICIVTIFVANGNMGSMILAWAFMSMGLRGCTVLLPLLGAMFFPRRITPAAGIASALLGPLANFLWKLSFPAGLDPLYPGLLVSLLVLIIVSMFTEKKEYA